MYYDINKVEPNKESREKLFYIVNYLQKNPEVTVLLNGYTDSLGSVEVNQKLSQRRALNLKNILQGYNIAGNRIQINANGIDTTFSNKQTGDPLARRVDIIFNNKQ